MSPFDFFRQESSHMDVVTRTEAMNRVIYILALMEPDKVRSEMIPYIQSKLSSLTINFLLVIMTSLCSEKQGSGSGIARFGT
jgi:hypothetical protein